MAITRENVCPAIMDTGVRLAGVAFAEPFIRNNAETHQSLPLSDLNKKRDEVSMHRGYSQNANVWGIPRNSPMELEKAGGSYAIDQCVREFGIRKHISNLNRSGADSRIGFREVELTHLGPTASPAYGDRSSQDLVDVVNRFGLKTRAMNVSTSRMVNGSIQRVVLSDRSQTKGIIAYTTWYLQLARLLGAQCVSFPISPRVLDAGSWKRQPMSPHGYSER